MLVLAFLWILRGWWTGGGSASWQSDDASDPTWIDRIAQGTVAHSGQRGCWRSSEAFARREQWRLMHGPSIRIDGLCTVPGHPSEVMQCKLCSSA